MDYRRAARDLALRVLFQADVGRQPIRAALSSVMDQLAASVRSGLVMAAKQAERALKNRPVEPLVLESQTRKRERRRVHGHVNRRIALCAEALTELAAGAVALQPERTVESVLEAFPIVTGPHVARLQKVLSGSTLDREELRSIQVIIDHAMNTMRTTLEKRLPVARLTADMVKDLAVGAWQHRASLDEKLRDVTQQWPLERQSAPDRNILRLAAYELLYRSETPPAVVINEAVELAKRYGEEESSRFVNGVLAALARQSAATNGEQAD